MALDIDTRDLVANMVRYQRDDRKIAQYADCDVSHVRRARTRLAMQATGDCRWTGIAFQPDGNPRDALGADSFTRRAIKASEKLVRALERVGGHPAC